MDCPPSSSTLRRTCPALRRTCGVMPWPVIGGAGGGRSEGTRRPRPAPSWPRVGPLGSGCVWIGGMSVWVRGMALGCAMGPRWTRGGGERAAAVPLQSRRKNGRGESGRHAGDGPGARTSVCGPVWARVCRRPAKRMPTVGRRADGCFPFRGRLAGAFGVSVGGSLGGGAPRPPPSLQIQHTPLPIGPPAIGVGTAAAGEGSSC